jgi:caffeoyl-CoA O-methyltransferase
MNKLELQKVKEKALNEKIPIIMDETLKAVVDILVCEKQKRLLEIGTAVGYSSLCFSEYVEEIDTIEIEEIRMLEAIENIKKCALYKINVINADASIYMKEITKKYDFIFIDAAKGKYLLFLEEALKLINANRGNNSR